MIETGDVAVITGAASGIGEALARQLAAADRRPVLRRRVTRLVTGCKSLSLRVCSRQRLHASFLMARRRVICGSSPTRRVPTKC